MFVGSGNEGAGDCFVPGVVIATPCTLDSKDKLYTVFKFDNRKVGLFGTNADIYSGDRLWCGGGTED